MSEGWEQAYEPQSPTSEGEYGRSIVIQVVVRDSLVQTQLGRVTEYRGAFLGAPITWPALRVNTVSPARGNTHREQAEGPAHALPVGIEHITCYPYLRLQVDREHGSGCQQSWEMYKPSESRELYDHRERR